MMREILLINPQKRGAKKKRKTTTPKKRTPPKSKGARKKPAKSKGVKTMPAKKKGAKKRKGKKRGKNPRAGGYGRKAYTRARSAFAGLNFRSALKNAPAFQIGMFASKWAAKRFSDEYPATETDPESWNYASYLKGGLGATIAAFLAQMIRPGMGQKVLEGGLNLMLFKLVENELIPQSDWATEQFGMGQEDIVFDEYGTPYMLGQGGYYPVDERHRLPEEFEGGALEPVGPLGDALEPVGPLGEDDPWAEAFLGQGDSKDPFARAFM